MEVLFASILEAARELPSHSTAPSSMAGSQVAHEIARAAGSSADDVHTQRNKHSGASSELSHASADLCIMAQAAQLPLWEIFAPHADSYNQLLHVRYTLACNCGKFAHKLRPEACYPRETCSQYGWVVNADPAEVHHMSQGDNSKA